MDVNGTPFGHATYLEDIGITLDQVYQVITVENIENRYLVDALTKLRMSPGGLDDPAMKGYKLYALLSARGITISNLIQLHKQARRLDFERMFFAFINAVSKNSHHISLKSL